MTGRYRPYADAGIQVLLDWYDYTTGVWNGTHWWNSANALGTLIDYASSTQNTVYCDLVANTFEKNQAGEFVNDFYDDEGWWALTWTKAYDLTGERRYLQMAQSLFYDMQGGWDVEGGGGLWWSKERAYKAAIANELFLLLAARLHIRAEPVVGSTVYLEWAQRAWEWFRNGGLIGPSGLVVDGHGIADEWTYNQGVILAALADLYRTTKDVPLLATAQRIADAAIGTLVGAGGVLRERPALWNPDSPDQPQFKGIFVRNLAYFYTLVDKPAYRDFIFRNAESIWNNSRGAGNHFGPAWDAPAGRPNTAAHSSGLDAILAAMRLEEAVEEIQGKAIRHYLLFWHSGPDGWAYDDWAAANRFIARFQPTCGFSLEEASRAERVTIVGDGWACSAEGVLRDAGCQVERLAGRDAQQTAALLDERARSARAFVGGTHRRG